MSELRKDVLKMLGIPPDHLRLSVHARVRAADIGGRVVEDIAFGTGDGTIIPGYFIHPPADRPPAPAILYCHAHGGRYDIGRAELFDGRPALTGPYAADLAARGYAVLCLEMPCFGQRADLREDATAKSMLWRGTTLFGSMVAELRAGVAFLTDHPQIDARRIATLGISMGGTHAWWLAALDPAVRAAVSMCCLADLGMLIETGAHDGHGNYMTVPGLLARCSTGALAGLAAPKPMLVCAGMQDWSTPEAAFARARDDLDAAYGTHDALDFIEYHVAPDVGHAETPAMRAAVLDFLERRLGPRE